MSTFPEILAVVESTSAAFEEFRKRHDTVLADVKAGQDALRERLEELEAKRMNPGRSSKAADPADTNDWVDSEGRALQVLRKGADFSALYAVRDPSERELTLTDFVRGVAGLKCSAIARKALEVGTDASGGYAVPTIIMPRILEALVPATTLLQAGAGIVNVDEGSGKAFNTAAINAIPTAAWRAESGAVSESGPTFRLVAATPRSLSFYFKVSRELLADAVNLDPALRITIAQAFAKELDRAGLRGSGTPPEPRGILNTSGIQSVTNGANGASLATTAYANFISALNALLAADAPAPTAAIMAPRSLTTLAGLLDTTNQPRAVPAALQPWQMLATSQIPTNLTVGTSTDCTELYIGDFSRLMFFMRERPSIQLANDLFALNGQVGFVCHTRVDVVCQYPAAFAVVTGVRA